MKNNFIINTIVVFISFSTMGFASDVFLKQWQNQTETFVEVKESDSTNKQDQFLDYCNVFIKAEARKCKTASCFKFWENENKKCENNSITVAKNSLNEEEQLPEPIIMPTDNEVSLGISGACVSILNIKQFRIIHSCYHMDGSIDTTVYSKEATERLFLDGKLYYDQFLSFYMSAGTYDKTPGMLNIDLLDAEYAPNCPLWPFYQCISLDAFRKYLIIFGYKNTIILHPGQIVFDQYVKGHHTLEDLRKWGAKKIRNLFTGELCHNSVCLTDQQVKDLVEWGEITEDGTNVPVPTPTPTPTPDPIHPGQIVFDQYVKGHHTLEALQKWGAIKIRNLFTGDLCHQSVCLTDQQVKDLVEWGKITENGTNPVPVPTPTPTPTPDPVHPGQIVFDQYVKGHHTLEALQKWGARKIRNLFTGDHCHSGVCLTDQQVKDLVEWGKITENGTDDDDDDK